MKRTKEDWIAAAKSALVSEGVEAVRIDRLAKRLGVTRGGFYGYFKSRDALLDALLDLWRIENTAPLVRAVDEAAPDGVAQYDAVTDVWVAEELFSPPYDSAVRDWGRTDEKVAKAVRKEDEKRIKSFEGMFLNMGYSNEEAQIRARVMYYHQIGYYAMDVQEPHERRRKNLKMYRRVLTGLDTP
ncbi:MAG: helix-turn-helix domain-containing protein [Pseudomonadota bacterium]